MHMERDSSNKTNYSISGRTAASLLQFAEILRALFYLLPTHSQFKMNTS